MHSTCRTCGKRNLSFCSVQHETVKKLMEHVPTLVNFGIFQFCFDFVLITIFFVFQLNAHESHLPTDVCIDCYQTIKNLVFSIENIKDAQKILRIKNNARVVADPSISSMRNSVSRIDFEEIKFEKREHPPTSTVKQYGSPSKASTLTVRKVPPTLSASPTPTENSLLRKRSISVVEDIEKKYTNIKLRKVEGMMPPPNPTSIEIKTQTKQVQIQKQHSTVPKKTSTPPQVKPQIIVVQESPPKKIPQKIAPSIQSQIKKSPSKLMCVKCTQKFDSREEHTKHICKKPPNTPTICFCGTKFESQEELQKHVNSDHKNNTKHVCSVCKSEFTSKDSFQLHMKSHQQTTNKSPATLTVPKRYACRTCKEKFTDLILAQKHSKDCKAKTIET